MEKNYYQLLDIKQNANKEEIEHAFRAKMKIFHPDHAPKGKEVEYTAIAQKLNLARKTLINSEKRMEYNNTIIAEIPEIKDTINSFNNKHVDSIEDTLPKNHIRIPLFSSLSDTVGSFSAIVIIIIAFSFLIATIDTISDIIAYFN